MSTSTRINYDQLEEMTRQGFMADSEDRYELLWGEVCLMTQAKPPHEFIVEELTEWSFAVLKPGTARVRVQCSLGIPAMNSLTLPDVAWMRRDDYSNRRPLAEDVLLLIEVADSTLSEDRNREGKIYAEAGLRDYWVVNVKGRRLGVRRDPEAGVYRSVLTLKPGEDVCPLAFPGAVLPVSRLFPAGNE